MSVSFTSIKKGARYSRHSLAELWGYRSYQALARGVVTPREDNKIILFVTENKDPSAEQYQDHLSGTLLEWEGPNDHFAEERIVNAAFTPDEIHLFYRKEARSDFTYHGRVRCLNCTVRRGKPSQFTFRLP